VCLVVGDGGIVRTGNGTSDHIRAVLCMSNDHELRPSNVENVGGAHKSEATILTLVGTSALVRV
jgi:hypothetical protein